MGYSHDEWTPLIIHEKMAGNRDAQSHAQIIIIKQNSPRVVACLDGNPVDSAGRGVCLLVVGGV